MRIHKHVLALAMSCVLTSVLAQENETVQLKHDIGFNTNFVIQNIFDATQTPFDLMYKTYRSENKAIRYGISFFASTRNSESHSTSSNNSYSDYSYFSLSPSIGKEFQSVINKHWVYYYGGDMIATYGKNTSDSFFGNGDKYMEYLSESYGLRARPFIGLRFNINPRLYLVTELSVSVAYWHTSDYQRNIQNDQVERDLTSKSVALSLNRATGILLFYRF
jgi:hypothetical protein